MDFKQIEAFVYVAKYKSFSRAAEKMLLSQPTISTHINTLEEELNIKLFDRLSREVILTDAGQLFYDYAVDMMDLRERSIEAIKEFLNEISGNIRIGSSTIIAEFILPMIIKEFNNRYPKTFFSMDISNSQTIIQRVVDGILDLAIVARKIPKKDLEYKTIFKDKIILAVNREHPFYSRNNLFLEEIINEKFVIREVGSGTRNAVEYALKSKGYDFESLNATAVMSSTHGLLHSVKNGLGVAFVSEIALIKDICGQEVKGIPIIDLVVEKDIFLVYNKRKTSKKLIKSFLELMDGYNFSSSIKS
ncbi:MAG: LysR family transcriptional regulator [Calditerrivibrio sp.]|nr:LysR family transcriptional regulator [Calditerrivibrio sp.]MCA1980499.1 LysR family transcriptional regulator [Calditerrivibrio sp.]